MAQSSEKFNSHVIHDRVGLFVEWPDCIGGTLEDRRVEYRKLLGEMGIYEGDLNEAELQLYHQLATSSK